MDLTAILNPPDRCIALIIFCQSSTTSAAEVIVAEAVALWNNLGWECSHQIVQPSSDHPIKVPFEGQKRHHTLLVHLTEFVQKMSYLESYEDGDLLEILAIARRRLRNRLPCSISSHAIIVFSGKSLFCPEEVECLELNITSLFDLDNILASLRLRAFVPQDWASFIADIGTRIIISANPVASDLIQVWMKNQRLLWCTDLALISANQPTLLLLGSPFTGRPLGKALPDISRACSCQEDPTRRRRKRWVVKHNCQGGMSLKDARITAECSSCGQYWNLESSDMVGEVQEVNGMFAVVFPYFK